MLTVPARGHAQIRRECVVQKSTRTVIRATKQKFSLSANGQAVDSTNVHCQLEGVRQIG
jgi:hypothetical protein